MIRKAKVFFAELSFDALPITEVSDVFERVEHDGVDGSRQVTFVYDDFECPCKANSHGGTFEVFEEYFRKEIEDKFEKEILRLERLGSFPRLSFSLTYGNASCRKMCSVTEYCEVSREMVGKLASKGMSLAMSYVTKGYEARVEVPASLVKFLAKYHFAMAF